MTKPEKKFQDYFMRTINHGYRTALANGTGFPDCLLIDGAEHYFVELKMLDIGPSGDKMLRGSYTKLQPPWHTEYLAKGGERLYSVFKLKNSYGIVHETMSYIKAVVAGLKYLDMKENYFYYEYRTLKELVDVHFS
jgi:hypothetical protein